MDMDSATDQGPSNDSDGQEGTASNNVDRAAAEFNSVIAAHHTTPAIVGGARAFTRLQASAKLLHLYLAIEEIRSTVGALTRPDGFGFALPPNLEENIKTYSIVILAQPALQTYDINILVNYMMAIIRKMRWGLPDNAENTPHIWNHVAKFARSVISNRRCDWKKEVAKSAKSKTHILVLAKKLTKKIPGFEMQEALLVRLAVLRFVYVLHPGDNYWPSVNNQLKTLEEEETGVRNSVLRQLFVEDETKYREQSLGAIVTESTQSNNSQAGCPIMAETAEMMSQTADTSS